MTFILCAIGTDNLFRNDFGEVFSMTILLWFLKILLSHYFSILWPFSMWENVFNDLVSSVVVLTVIKTIVAVVIVIVVVVVAWQKVEEYIFFQTIKLVCFFHPNLQPINFTFIAFFWSHDSLISSPSAFLSTLIYLL